MLEKWKDVDGYEGLYKISNLSGQLIAKIICIVINVMGKNRLWLRQFIV